jgi:hypothetical protein
MVVKRGGDGGGVSFREKPRKPPRRRLIKARLVEQEADAILSSGIE